MTRISLALLSLALTAQPKEGNPGHPADIAADLARRTLAANAQLIHPSTRSQAEQRRDPLRAQLRYAIGIHRVSQPVNLILFPQPLSAPTLLILSPNCLSIAQIYGKRGFSVACLDDAPRPTADDILAGITPQGRAQNAVARALHHLRQNPAVDPSRIALLGEGPTATLAAAIHLDFARIALSNPQIDDALIYGIAKFATTEDLLSLCAPRPLLLNSTTPTIGANTLNQYRLFDAGAQIFFDRDPAHWLAPNPLPGIPPTPITIQLPPEPAAPDERHQLPQVAGDTLPEGYIANSLNTSRRQERFWETQPGIRIPVTFYRSGAAYGNASHGLLYAISDEGAGALESDEIVQGAISRDWTVVTIDPRGLGAMKADPSPSASFQLGESFVWRQATDVARVIAFNPAFSANTRIALYATGPNATLIAAFIAATAPANKPEWIALRRPLSSFAQLPIHLVPFYSAFTMESLLQSARVPVVPITSPDDFLRQDWLIK